MIGSSIMKDFISWYDYLALGKWLKVTWTMTWVQISDHGSTTEVTRTSMVFGFLPVAVEGIRCVVPDSVGKVARIVWLDHPPSATPVPHTQSKAFCRSWSGICSSSIHHRFSRYAPSIVRFIDQIISVKFDGHIFFHSGSSCLELCDYSCPFNFSINGRIVAFNTECVKINLEQIAMTQA